MKTLRWLADAPGGVTLPGWVVAADSAAFAIMTGNPLFLLGVPAGLALGRYAHLRERCRAC